METIDIIVILSTAFLGSMGHCVGMCGGIVVAYTSTKIGKTFTKMQETFAHLFYNMGRVVTYSVLGGIFGWIGQVVAFTPLTKGLLFVVTGVLMLLAGLSLLGKLKFLMKVETTLTRYTWYKKSFRYLMENSSYKSFFLLGMLNGLIPCGLVYSFAIFAASTASPLHGAWVMAMFGLATIPALFFLGLVTRVLQKGSRRSIMMQVSAFLVLFYGLFTLHKGYQFIVHPQKMQKMLDEMQTGSIENKLQGKCGSMKCAPGKCG